jgi:hypothetical protein
VPPKSIVHPVSVTSIVPPPGSPSLSPEVSVAVASVGPDASPSLELDTPGPDPLVGVVSPLSDPSPLDDRVSVPGPVASSVLAAAVIPAVVAPALDTAVPSSPPHPSHTTLEKIMLRRMHGDVPHPKRCGGDAPQSARRPA